MTAGVFQIRVANTGATVPCAAGQTILAASVAAGVEFPYGCASGNCGACLATLDAGEVAMLPRNDAALRLAQEAEGKTLACRAVPRSDVAVTWLGRGRR